jgi:hypothetical protein
MSRARLVAVGGLCIQRERRREGGGGAEGEGGGSKAGERAREQGYEGARVRVRYV